VTVLGILHVHGLPGTDFGIAPGILVCSIVLGTVVGVGLVPHVHG